MAESPKMSWYVLRAISGKENQVREYISKLDDDSFRENVSQVLIPTEKVTSVRPNGKKVTKERAYLPGYVLVEARLVGDIAHKLSNLPNVIGFLADDPSHPTPLRDSEVKRILGTVDANMEETVEADTCSYTVGEAVKVIYGPFSSFSGTIEEINREKKTLKVVVKIFGRETPVELGYAQVEKE